MKPEKNCRLELNVLPSNQTGLTTDGSIMLSQKTVRGNFTAKILKIRWAKQKKQNKSARRVVRKEFSQF